MGTMKRLACRIFGHKKPYEQRLWCEICPRCRIITTRKAKPPRLTAFQYD